MLVFSRRVFLDGSGFEMDRESSGFTITKIWRGQMDTLFALGIIFILLVLFIPLSPVLLDIGLAVSLALSVLVLMVALWIDKPLAFSSFPTILLVVTMLRLALNIASTRLILSDGHTGHSAAGKVIQGFSQFVMSGSFIIGVIIFSILVVINFVVITKGATRIAEVGARFTLDAIPGKQMAIDADLSAGIINEEQARVRRKELEDESSFFGSMDGAAKFVRGDAVAGIIITFVNIIGGIIVGMTAHGLTAGQAADYYTTLTVGDGLVSQIPALIVSLAAGIVVTKGGNRGPANASVLSQLGGHPKALAIASALMFAVALLPGFPVLVFVALGALLGVLAWHLSKENAAREAAERRRAAESEQGERKELSAEDLLKLDAIRLELSPQLIPLVSSVGSTLSQKVKNLRQMFALEYGFLLPSIRIKDNSEVPDNHYILLVEGVEVARGMVRPGASLAINPDGQRADIHGEKTREPTFGLPAVWIDQARSDEAVAKGYTVVDPESVILTHMTESIKENLPNLLTYAMTQRLVEGLDREYQNLVKDMMPQNSSLVLIQRVLQNLLSERISIRNLPLIVESAAEATGWTRNVTLVTEHVRGRLAAQICQQIADEDGFLPIVTVSPEWDRELLEAVVVDGEDRRFVMSPNRVQEFIMAVRKVIQDFANRDEWPALVVNPDARPYVRAMLERVSANTPVISHNEIYRKVSLKTVAQVT